AYDQVSQTWDMTLRARGIVLQGANAPIVLCAIDWIGIGNEGYTAFRQALADGAGTTPDRVAVHCVHQHDAPGCDFSAEHLLNKYNIDASRYEGDFARAVLVQLEQAVHTSLKKSQPITHLGLGEAPVYEVASNRRILGEDGKVRVVRYTTCKDPAVRAEPEGVIDPMVSVVSFWNEETPVAVLSYYACHPQSYYRTGIPNPDFPGVARFFRQLAVPSALHVHFNGAGGNLGAGKYNDGSHENRLALAEKLADGMRRAWETTKRSVLTPEDIAWHIAPTEIPAAPWLSLESLEKTMIEQEDPARILGNATRLAWLQRCAEGYKIDITCLALGRARLLHMPGELFVEYQLGAKVARPDLFVAMAAYGDYATGYIGTTKAYSEGGYETSEAASNVAPETEAVLMAAVKKLLQE
ncbi:MAG: hypothetical protein KAH38_01185, partial [Candidatus Hydrogenedentes bacterium]|nr:hypothetical protein [Candidatus Hydrogenedentota bacterium]